MINLFYLLILVLLAYEYYFLINLDIFQVYLIRFIEYSNTKKHNLSLHPSDFFKPELYFIHRLCEIMNLIKLLWFIVAFYVIDYRVVLINILIDIIPINYYIKTKKYYNNSKVLIFESIVHIIFFIILMMMYY